jgi:peptidoglycan/xylan/chitin deacetylase (PgdA/CDA1 family)
MPKPALISLTFDDGLRSQLENAIPILDQYGFPATFFLIANHDTFHERPNWSKTDWHASDIKFLKNMIQRGHEIGAHTKTHISLEKVFDERKLKDEVEGSKLWIEDRLGLRISSFCYPFYTAPQTAKNAVLKAGYKQARSGARSTHISRGFSNWFAVDCHPISKNENVAGWARPGCWHVLTFHGIGGENDGWEPIAVDEFAGQMAELSSLRDSGNVEVVTFNDGADFMRH